MQILTVLESRSWADFHIAGSLEDMGHEVHRFFYGEGVGEFYGHARSAEREQKNDKLVDDVRRVLSERGLDLIFCYVYDDFLLPRTARQLAGFDIPMVNLNVDMVNQWYRQTRTARFFTRMLCAQRANMENMARYGGKTIYFPMAARLPKMDLVNGENFTPANQVTFVGTPMPYRKRVLRQLVEAGIPLAVYGKYWDENRIATPDRRLEKTISDVWFYGWPKLRAEGLGSLVKALQDRIAGLKRKHTSRHSEDADNFPRDISHGFVPDSALPALLKRSRINLGFTRMIGDDPAVPGVNQVKLRDFEVPLAGGFYLTEHAPDYDELFNVGVEVETWRTMNELCDKVRYYLDHDSERQQIADAGYKRAVRDHTWQQRFRALFAELGISGDQKCASCV